MLQKDRELRGKRYFSATKLTTNISKRRYQNIIGKRKLKRIGKSKTRERQNVEDNNIK